MALMRLILIGWYLILSLGMSIHLHYCMGRLKTVELVLHTTQTCPCHPGDWKPKCCEDEFITLSVDEPHLGPQSLTIPSLLALHLASPHALQLNTLDDEAAFAANLLDLRGPPPLKVPRYLAYQAMMLYA